MTVAHAPAPSEVIARIDALGPGDWIATDCDGTLWRGDIGDDVVRAAAAEPEAFGLESCDFEAYEELIRADYEGACLAACGVLRQADQAVAAAAIDRVLGADFSPRVWLLEALQDALKRGVEVWLVSASPRLAVQVGAKRVGIEPSQAIGIELAESGYRAPWPIDTGKPAACRSRGKSAPAVALGDTRWDMPLLQWASQGFMLTPADQDAHLLDSADSHRG